MQQHQVIIKRKSIVARVVDLFPSPIHVEEMLLDVNSIREECYRREKNDSGRMISNMGGYQSEDYFLPDEFFGDLMLRIETAGNAFADYIGIGPVQMANFWININRKGNCNQRHQHPRCQLSGVYYVKVPPNSGAIKFYNPTEQFMTREWFIKEPTLYSSEAWSFETNENELFIFPAWLDHMVKPNFSDEDRISISFNLRYAGFG